MLATLQCMHALMSGAGGMGGVLGTPGFLPAVCAVLARPREQEAAKLVVEMLIKFCLFSSESYRLAVKVSAARCLSCKGIPAPDSCGGSAHGEKLYVRMLGVLPWLIAVQKHQEDCASCRRCWEALRPLRSLQCSIPSL